MSVWKCLFVIEIGGKTNIRLKINHKSPSDSDVIEQQNVEKVETQGRVSPNIPEPPNARQDDMQSTEANGLDDTAVAPENVSNNGKSYITWQPVCQEDLIDLSSELTQSMCDEEKEEVAVTSSKEATKTMEAESESDLVIPQQKSSTESHTWKDQLPQAASYPVPDSFDSPSTANVFIAAPQDKNQKLAIVGENDRLGKWRRPHGKFEAIMQIDADLYVFKGVVPVPSVTGSKFKFAHVNKSNDKIEYEGDGTGDNRTEELLPDSWNFFIFKQKPKSIIGKLLKNFGNSLQESGTEGKIATKFFHIVFVHTLENVLPGTVLQLHTFSSFDYYLFNLNIKKKIQIGIML